ncbi:MAG: hypothetical protein HY692_09145 [Cyanobacteria bacterium NC_groundwater_1444_Ag_S-0.65um_54_12]|nr:hypothetical protein [Cyanobacteria bacterium NC_groundwater_1444_Ag_S-0.65um_54_12]
MRRAFLTLGMVLIMAMAPAGRLALAVEDVQYLPYTFEPIWLSLYDNQTEAAFFPSKGINGYEGKESLPGGYVDPPPAGIRGLPMTFFTNNGMFSEDYTRRIFALIRLKVTNRDTNRSFKVFNASDFFLESLRGSVYRPHPFTIATTRRLAYPGEAIFLTLGFEVPPGVYTLVYKDTTPTGGQVLAEVWRYDININRAPLYGAIAALVLLGAAVAAVLLIPKK